MDVDTAVQSGESASTQSPETNEAAAILRAVADILCKEVAMEIHRELFTGILSMEALYAHPPKEATTSTRSGTDIFGRVPTKEPNYTIPCHVCSRQVGILKYAPHLDKCMNVTGGRNRGGASSATGDPGSSLLAPGRQTQSKRKRTEQSAPEYTSSGRAISPMRTTNNSGLLGASASGLLQGSYLG